MEPLPNGANFKRAKMLWEIGLHVAGDPNIRYGGNRDMCITVGSGGQADFRPALRLATGSAIMAHDVCAGNLDMAFVNPSALLTQAYRGVGLFDAALPVRIVGSYPSTDSFAIVVHERTGLETVADIKKAKAQLKISLREDPTHSTLVLVEQLFNIEGFSIQEFLDWGGEIKPTGPPAHEGNRLQPLRDGTLDAVADEAIYSWLDIALGHGYKPLDFSDDTLDALSTFGWRRSVLSPGGPFPNLSREYTCIDFGGWPLYTRADMADDAVYGVCAAIAAREDEIPWEERTYSGVLQPFTETIGTPMDVPLHPGAERWLKENGG